MDLCLILLTYKGKILLTGKDYPDHVIGKSPWCFINAEEKLNSSSKETILKRVKEETAISLNSVEFLSSCKHKNNVAHFFHAKLTDDNVNRIRRQEGRLINFYSVNELKNLSLTVPSQLLIERHSNLLSSSSL